MGRMSYVVNMRAMSTGANLCEPVQLDARYKYIRDNKNFAVGPWTWQTDSKESWMLQ